MDMYKYKFRPIDKCSPATSPLSSSAKMLEDVEQQTALTGETRPEEKPVLTPAQIKLAWAVGAGFLFYILSCIFCFCSSGATDIEIILLTSFFVDMLGFSFIPIAVYFVQFRGKNHLDILYAQGSHNYQCWCSKSWLLISMISLSLNLVGLCLVLVLFGYLLSTVEELHSQDSFVITMRNLCVTIVILIPIHIILIWLGVIVLKEERKVYVEARDTGVLEAMRPPLVPLTDQEKAKLALTPSQKKLTWAFGASALVYTVSFIFCVATFPTSSTDSVTGLFSIILLFATPMMSYIIGVLVRYLCRNTPRMVIVGEKLRSFIRYRWVGWLIWGIAALSLNCLILGLSVVMEGETLFSSLDSRSKSLFVTIIILIPIHILLIWLGVLVVKDEWRSYKAEKENELLEPEQNLNEPSSSAAHQTSEVNEMLK